jgi:hypothetical protein
MRVQTPTRACEANQRTIKTPPRRQQESELTGCTVTEETTNEFIKRHVGIKLARLDLGDKRVNGLNAKASSEHIQATSLRGLRTPTHTLKKPSNSQTKSKMQTDQKTTTILRRP